MSPQRWDIIQGLLAPENLVWNFFFRSEQIARSLQSLYPMNAPKSLSCQCCTHEFSIFSSHFTLNHEPLGPFQQSNDKCSSHPNENEQKKERLPFQTEAINIIQYKKRSTRTAGVGEKGSVTNYNRNMKQDNHTIGK